MRKARYFTRQLTQKRYLRLVLVAGSFQFQHIVAGPKARLQVRVDIKGKIVRLIGYGKRLWMDPTLRVNGLMTSDDDVVAEYTFKRSLLELAHRPFSCVENAGCSVSNWEKRERLAIKFASIATGFGASDVLVRSGFVAVGYRRLVKLYRLDLYNYRAVSIVENIFEGRGTLRTSVELLTHRPMLCGMPGDWTIPQLQQYTKNGDLLRFLMIRLPKIFEENSN